MPVAPSNANRSGRRAFTLIELLVVIGIIAVLIGLILPVVSKSRVQARSLVCMSRLREIGVAFSNYAVAGKGRIRFMSTGYWTNPRTHAVEQRELYWFGAVAGTEMTAEGGLLEPYLPTSKPEEIFDCPAAEDSQMTSLTAYYHGNTSRGVAYGASFQFYFSSYNPVRLSRIRNTSETVLLADAAVVDTRTNALYRSPTTGAVLNIPTIHARHGDRANVLWFDGHVSSETVTYMASWFAPVEAYKSHKVGQLTRGDINSKESIYYYFYFDKQRRTIN